MISSIITTILFMFSFLIFSRYLIHLYYKSRRKLLFNQIGGKDFIEIKNIPTEIYSKTKTSFSWKDYTSNIILLDDALLILLRNSILNGLITQNQSIIQISKTENNRKQPGVERVYFIEKKEFRGNKICFHSSQKVIVTAKIEITLNFKENIEQLDNVKKYVD